MVPPLPRCKQTGIYEHYTSVLVYEFDILYIFGSRGNDFHQSFQIIPMHNLNMEVMVWSTLDENACFII